jgi:hypothetical protein
MADDAFIMRQKCSDVRCVANQQSVNSCGVNITSLCICGQLLRNTSAIVGVTFWHVRELSIYCLEPTNLLLVNGNSYFCDAIPNKQI